MWTLAHGSVVGQSHLTKGLPGQDRYEIATSSDGRWVAAVVCDGAGSAARADEGAQIVAKYFSEELIKLSADIDKDGPGQWINDRIIECVLEVRRRIRGVARQDDLSEFHCTLVATLLSDAGGFAIQIGDGLIIGGKTQLDAYPEGDAISLDFISKPENGEYVNETFFITEPRWLKHIRISPISASCDWLMLATDGGAAYLLDAHDDVIASNFHRFLESLLVMDLKSAHVEDALNSKDILAVSSDDKTIVFVSKINWTRISEINNFILTRPDTLSTLSVESSLKLKNGIKQEKLVALARDAEKKPFLKKKLEIILNRNHAIQSIIFILLVVVAILVIFYMNESSSNIDIEEPVVVKDNDT
jgi:hypothetical protein